MNLSFISKATSHTVIAVLAGAVLVACGDDSGGDNSTVSTSSDASAASGSAPEATSSAAQSSSEDGAGSAPPAASDFCTELESLVTASENFFEVIFAEISGKPAPTADELREAAEPVGERVVKASMAAPDDLADELEVMGAYLLSATGAVEAANYDVDAVTGDFPQPDAQVNAAEDTINEYARTECGFDPDA